jgi:uncharacterized protein (DUF1778 family)
MSVFSMDNHMHFRMSSNDKQLIEEAAKLKGIKPNAYARQCLIAAAERDLAELSQQNRIVLNEEDWDVFMHMLQAPVAENKNLKRAMSSYKKYFGDI